MKIALLGPKNTFSDISADKYIKKTRKKIEKYFAKDIEEVFELVEKGEMEYGIVPVENKLNGTVRDSLDGLFEKKVEIIDEIDLPVKHSLIVKKDSKKSDIKKIISHSQALSQCKNFIRKNFKKTSLEAYSSTAAAIQKLIKSRDKSVAVIAHKKIAKNANLKILKSNIEDKKGNSTRFVVIKKGEATLEKTKSKNQNGEQKNYTKTSIAFYFDKDSAGSLYEVLKRFAKAKINLTKIESRPTQKKFGDYIFYIDFEGGIDKRKIRKTLKSIEKKVAKLKILGSY